MTYYKVKEKADQFPRLDGSVLIKDELYTEKEMKKYSIPKGATDIINLPSRNTRWFFGARFAC